MIDLQKPRVYIEDLSLPQLEISVVGIKAILWNYEHNEHMDKCPLCAIAAEAKSLNAYKMHDNKSTCDFCPWKIMKNKSCIKYACEKFNTTNIDNTHSNKKWRKLRIKQLKKWLSAYREQINKYN